MVKARKPGTQSVERLVLAPIVSRSPNTLKIQVTEGDWTFEYPPSLVEMDAARLRAWLRNLMVARDRLTHG